MLKYLKYYFGTSYRRKILDSLLEDNKHYYKGIVLDIGGRDRGKFKKPKDKVEKWIFADMVNKHSPDIILDVADMSQIQNGSINTINATELFEHVRNPEKGLKECYRILKENGAIILSAPFLYPVHNDPYDFQRWTEQKWKDKLQNLGFRIEVFKIMGRYFTVVMDMKKVLIENLPFGISHFLKLFYPLMDLLAKLDDTAYVKNNLRLSNYHQGYFIICKK